MEVIQTREQWLKSQEKKRLKSFWKRQWVPGRSPETWLSCLGGSRRRYKSVTHAEAILIDALKKLCLERRIMEVQVLEMTKMLRSPDKENAYLVICIIQGLKPRMFQRREKQTNQ